MIPFFFLFGIRCQPRFSSFCNLQKKTNKKTLSLQNLDWRVGFIRVVKVCPLETTCEYGFVQRYCDLGVDVGGKTKRKALKSSFDLHENRSPALWGSSGLCLLSCHCSLTLTTGTTSRHFVETQRGLNAAQATHTVCKSLYNKKKERIDRAVLSDTFTIYGWCITSGWVWTKCRLLDYMVDFSTIVKQKKKKKGSTQSAMGSAPSLPHAD